jgi:transcriptional regulator GlxA family with amidase domain
MRWSGIHSIICWRAVKAVAYNCGFGSADRTRIASAPYRHFAGQYRKQFRRSPLGNPA